MKPFVAKVECANCGGKYFIYVMSLPDGILPGEAFPHPCPLCCQSGYAIYLVDED